MVKQYQAACPDAQIFIGLPPTVYNDAGKFEGISEENVTSLIIPCLEEVAAETGATVVDTHTATANAKEHFTDGVHPSDDIARGMIAQAMADAILEWIN